ncbi:MAG: head GIN domain-containing protein [Bacteroidales bacterium]
MKTKTALLLLSLPIFLSSCIISGWDNAISGNGNVREESRNVDGFDGVHVSSGIDVLLSQGADFEVVVETDENLHEIIETYVEGSLLVVKTDHVSIRNAKAKRVHVTLPELRELKISSAGDCVGQTPFSCKDLRLEISSAGDLTLDVDAEDIHLDISSSGDCDLSGRCDEFRASLSSAGDLDAFELEARKVDVSASSAGDAKVWASEEISMNASSAGNIYYRGDAQVVNSRTSSAGNIVKRD